LNRNVAIFEPDKILIYAKPKYKVMKKQVTILLSFVFLFFISEAGVFAQKTTTEKKVQIEKNKKEEEMQKAQKEKQRVEELYKARMIDASTRRAELAEIDRAVGIAIPELSKSLSVAYADGNYAAFFGGSQDSETLEFRKTVNESSFSKDFKFQVESTAKKVSISVSGDCKEGEIRIKILMPGGNTYTEVLLDEYGSVNWNKSFGIDEEDTSKTGEWKFNIVAKEATGNFRLSIKSY